MGEARREASRVGFDHSIKLEFHGATGSSDGGLLTYRELDEVFHLTAIAREALADSRNGDNIQHDLMVLLRQSVFSHCPALTSTGVSEECCFVATTCKAPAT